jgi:hypothetical protein
MWGSSSWVSQQIDIDDRLVDIGRGVERQTPLADAGVIDKNIDLALPVARFFNFCGQGVIVGRFEGQDQRVSLDIRCHSLERFGAATRQYDMCALCGEGFCQGLADSGGSPGDPDNLTVKFHKFIPCSAALDFFQPTKQSASMITFPTASSSPMLVNTGSWKVK